MKKYLARDIAIIDNEWLWSNLRGEFILVFEDGEIETNWKETIYSTYAWRAFHVQYPLTPFLKKHHVKTIIKNGKLGSKTHLDLLGSCMWSTHDAYISNPTVKRDDLAKLIYQTTNVMYNELSVRLEEYVLSIDIIDFLEITDHPDVKEVLDNPTPDQQFINNAYNVLDQLLSDNDKLVTNPIAKACKAGLANKNQVLQCVGPRGYLTDIDSLKFPVPVMRGYVKGLRLLHDSLVESRSAAKSLYFSKDPLQDAEYFSRRLQLLCQIVENLYHTDCGSKEYLIWKVKPPVIEKGKVTYVGDLRHLAGKYYLDEITNKLVSIKATDVHLNGKTLKLRSVVAGCYHPDPHGVCSVCFGELSFSVPENTNLGHMCSTSMTQQTSQSVLSVKHSDGTAEIEGISLTKEAKWFLKVSSDGNSYLINLDRENSGMKIKFHSSKAIGLTDVNIVSNIEDLSITRVSEIDYISFLTYDKGVETQLPIPIMVSINNRLASLTHVFLAYIKKVGWFIDTDGNYVIDLTGWDFSKPVLTLPQKHFNMAAHSTEIANIIESRVDDTIERDKASTPTATLVELFELVNSKLSVNLAVLEIILYSAMIVSAEREDYRLPKPWTDKGLGVTSVTIPKRSLAIAYAYEYHRQTIVSPASFFNEHRESHLMDTFICPREVVEDLESLN
jgi:hypothetical protein